MSGNSNPNPGNDPNARKAAKNLDKSQARVYSDTIHQKYAPGIIDFERPAVSAQGPTAPPTAISQKVNELIDASGYPGMIEGVPITDEDRKYTLQSTIVDNQGVVPGYGKAQVDEKFFRWAQKQQEEAFALAFRNYVYSQIQLNTPEAREFWTQRFPEWTARVYEAHEQQAEMDKRLKLISLHGIRDESDMWLLYLKEKGVIFTSQNWNRRVRVIAEDNTYANLYLPVDDTKVESVFKTGIVNSDPPPPVQNRFSRNKNF